MARCWRWRSGVCTAGLHPVTEETRHGPRLPVHTVGDIAVAAAEDRPPAPYSSITRESLFPNRQASRAAPPPEQGPWGNVTSQCQTQRLPVTIPIPASLTPRGSPPGRLTRRSATSNLFIWGPREGESHVRSLNRPSKVWMISLLSLKTNL